MDSSISSSCRSASAKCNVNSALASDTFDTWEGETDGLLSIVQLSSSASSSCCSASAKCIRLGPGWDDDVRHDQSAGGHHGSDSRRGGARLSDGADHGCYGLGHSFTDLGGYLFCIARINPRLDCSAALRAGSCFVAGIYQL